MPGKPFQSKLLPHLEFIRECRAQRMSYPRIAAELQARFGLKTAPANIFSFVKVRTRRRPIYALPPPEPAHAPAAAPRPIPPAAGKTLPTTTQPVPNQPTLSRLSTLSTPLPTLPSYVRPRGPKIARDDY